MSTTEISQLDLTQGILFPAQSITSMCQEAQHVVDGLDPEVFEDIAHVLNSSKKLANLISDHISTIENRQGLKIACLEEIALKKGWIGRKDVSEAIKFYGNCEYSHYLKSLI